MGLMARYCFLLQIDLERLRRIQYRLVKLDKAMSSRFDGFDESMVSPVSGRYWPGVPSLIR